MNKQQLNSVMSSGTNVLYEDPFDYYMRIIRVLMSIAGDRNHLQPREREILAVMCLLNHEGVSLVENLPVMYRMYELGLNQIQSVTFRNYKCKLRARKWLIEDAHGQVQLNKQLQKAVDNKGLAVIIFLNS